MNTIKVQSKVSNSPMLGNYPAFHDDYPGLTWFDYTNGHYQVGDLMVLDVVLVDDDGVSHCDDATLAAVQADPKYPIVG